MISLPESLSNIGALGYTLDALSYFALSILLLISWKRRLLGGLLLLAVLYQIIWSGYLAALGNISQDSSQSVLVADEIRLLLWAIFLLEVLRQGSGIFRNKQVFIIAYALLAGGMLAVNLHEFVFADDGGPAAHFKSYLLNLVLATFGLILTEQFYRNTKPDRRWAIKYLCIGVGLLFAYDLYMYSHATLFEGISASLWNARGYVNIVAVPLLAISAARNPGWSVNVFVSRQVVFYTTGLTAIGIYLSLMAFGGYYIQIYGGAWGREAQIIFLAGALVVLFVILSSGSLRARAKLFLSKHFYKNKYDYREEWIGFIQKLSNFDSPKYLKEQILQNVATIMHSRGALLFLKQDDMYRNVSAWNTDVLDVSYPDDISLIGFLASREWIIDVEEYRTKPGKYASLDLPPDLLTDENWLIVPLKHSYNLVGFIVLLEPFVKMDINWEDRDLLKVIGKQVASYVALMTATDSLAVAEKFTAFNRLSAFVVHDMKNSVAQLDLITKNAAKFKNDPEFINDALLTVVNVVDRMKRMLSQLKRATSQHAEASRIDVIKALKEAVGKCASRQPVPQFRPEVENIKVCAEPDRFMNVIEHLIGNAQDATPETGEISVAVQCANKTVSIYIKDTGHGMSGEFIANHLFKPFDTTKGNAGMGVGVFEAREFVRQYGGQLNVTSTPGSGTEFEIALPEYNEDVSIESKFG